MVTKYSKKPVVIEAQQITRGNLNEVAEWCGGRPDREAFVDSDGWALDSPSILIDTLEGTMRASVGDWVICGVQGEFYPCKPDIFEMTYDYWAD